MLKKYLIAGTIALATLSTAAPTLAQSIELGRDGIQLRQDRADRQDRRQVKVAEISERQAVRIAKGEGVREVEDVRKTRSSYRIEGVDRAGDDITVNVDRASGDVLSVE